MAWSYVRSFLLLAMPFVPGSFLLLSPLRSVRLSFRKSLSHSEIHTRMPPETGPGRPGDQLAQTDTQPLVLQR